MSKSEALNRMRYKANQKDKKNQQTSQATQPNKTTQTTQRTGTTSYNKTERQNQSARKPTTARNATKYNNTARQNQSARKPTTARSGKGTITNSKGQKSTNQTMLTRQQMLNAVTGSGSPMGRLRQTAEAKNKGVTQRQVTQQAKETLPQAVTKGLEKAHQQRVRQLQEKLDKTTDRRARAAYRQELLEAKYPMSQADRKLPRSQQREIWEAKSLWDRGEQLKKRGQSKAGQSLQDYAHQTAEFRRYSQGYSGGVSGGDVMLPELTGRDRALSDEGQKQLRSYKLLYDYAKGTGDRAGMEAARTEAQKLRDTPGAWDPKKIADAEKTYTYAAALLEQQALYDRSGGQHGLQHKRQTLAWANETMKDLEAAYPDLGRSALSRVGLTLRGAWENTLGSLAEAAGWLLTPAEDGRNYRDRLTGDWADPKPLEQAASEMHSKADKLLGKSNEDLTAAKFGIGKLGDVAVDVGAFGAQMVPEMALGAVTGGVGGLAAMGARAFGGGAHEARQAGASYAKQGLYGLASAGTELVTEKLFSVAAPFRKAFGSGMQVGGKSLDEMLVKALNRVTKNPEAARLIAAAGTEGLEEVIADAVNPTIRSIYNGKTPLQNYKEEDVTNWLYDGMIGSILGGLGGVTGQVVSRRAGSGQETLPTEENRTEAEPLPRPDRSAAPTPTPTLGEETLRRAAEERVAEQTAPREEAPKTRQTTQAAPQAGRTAAEKLAAYRERYQAGQETAAQDRLAQAGRNLGEHGRKALSAAYEQGTDTADYFGGFSVLYEAGKAGKKAESVQSALVQSLTPAQKLAAYVAGQNDGKLAQPERGRTAGLVRTRAAEQLDPVTTQRLDDLGKALDTPIHVREDTGAGVNGWYDRQLGRIVVAAGSEKSTMTVAKHEITHRMQDLAPREYTAYRDYAAKILGGEEGTARLTAAYQERYAKAGVELSEEAALDEAAADFTEAMTEDPTLFRRLAEENPGPARTLVEAVKTFLRKIKSVFRGSRHRQDQAAAEAYGVTVRQLEKAARLWEKALTASSKTAQAQKNTEARNGDGGKRYSIDPNFGGKISAWDRAGRPEGERFTLGSTGPVLQGLGAIESDIYMNGDKIRKILHDHPEMTLREVRRIPEILEDPVLILKSKNVGRGSRQNTRLVIFGSLKAQNGSPVLAVLDLRPRERGFVLNDMQKVTSAYTKDNNPRAFLQNSDVMFLDKKRTTRLLSEIGFQTPISCNRSGYIGTIAYARDAVKLEGEPFSQVVELSGESGERLSLTGENLLEAEARAKAPEQALTASSKTAQAQKTTEARNGDGGKRYSIKQDAKRTEQRLQSVGLQLPSDTTELGSKTSIQERRENVKRYSIDSNFGGKLSAWDRAGRPEGERFTLGSTGPVLQGLGAIESDIYMNGDKIRKILHDHPEMTLREVRRIPEILEDPVLILKSKNVGRGSRQNTRLVIFGSLKAQNGSPVLAVLDLRPRERGFVLNDMQKVTSAYTKDKNPLEFIRSSDVLHVDAKRTIPLLRSIGFQMPIELQQDGSMGSISYKQRSVKIEGEPFSQVVELSEESGERLSLTGENLLEAEARAKALEKENAVLRERVEHFKNQTRQTEQPSVDRAEVRKQARALAKRYQATVTVDELSGRLQSLYDRLVQEKHMSWEVAYQEAKEIARDLAESAVTLNDGLYQEYAELRSYLKKTPLRISEEESHDIPDYNDWRKHYLGKVRIGKGKTNVDQVYQELSQMWPELFPQEGTEAAPVAPSDQLLHIARVAGDLYSVTEENPYSGHMEQITAEIANDVMASFFEVPQARKTFADRQQAKLEAEIAKGRERTRQAVAAEREARQREIKKIRDKYWDKRNEDLENRTAAELRGRILRHTQKLSRKLLKPTDKQHIPEEMRFAVAGVLDSINLTSAYVIDPDTGKRKKGDEGNPVKMTEKWLELKHACEMIQAEKAGLDNWVIDPDLMENLNELAGLGDVPIMKMSRKQLVTVWNTLKAVEASILNRDKAFGKARFSSISQAAADLRAENRGKREHRSLRGKLGEVGTDMMTPQDFFHRLGKTGDEIFRMLRNAQDEYITLLDGAQKKTEELLKANKAKVKQWEKETQTFQLHSGETLTLTTAQMMSLYELMKRPQAREHILLGGIRPEDQSRGLRDTTPAEPVQLDFGDCVQISLKLTEAQRDTADALQQYMAKDLAREGNRASLEVYGYEKFGETHYFPIRTDRNQVARDNAKEAKAQSIAGRGFTKGTVPNANNAVMLDSVFTVYANHVNEMLTYAAWLGPMENLQRIQNYVYRDEDGQRTGTVRAVIERVFGRTGNRYLNQLVDDLNQGVPASNSGNVFERLTANYKVASVSANIRVFAQQPSAVLRALDQVSLGDFLLGLARTKPGTWKKVMTYAPIARWKDWGYFDIHTGRQVRNVLLNDDKATDRVKEALMAPAGTMDSLAWSGLWNALEAETRRKHRELDAGSTAFYQAVAARFNEVIDRTQVVDGVLQRSQFMRKPDSLSKMATAFMAEPTKTYNQFMGAVYDLQQAQQPKERAQAMRRMGRTCFALTASIVVNAAVGQAFIDALRDDDDDEDYWEKYLQALTGLEGDEETLGEKLKGIAGGDLANDFLPWNYIPFVKDVASILEGYTAKRMDIDSIARFIKAMTNAMKAMQGDGALTQKNAVITLLAEAGRLTGWPVANIKRDIEAIWRTWLNGRGDLEGIYEMNKFLYAMNEKNAGRFYDLAAKAKEQGNDALLDRIEADLRAALPDLSAKEFDKKLEGKEKTKVQESDAYTERKDTLLQPLLEHLNGSEAYGKLSDEQKKYVQETLEGYAKGVATYEASKGEIAPSEAVQKLMAAANAGLDVADFVTLRALTKDLGSVKDPKTGKTIENSKSTLIRKAVEESGVAIPEDKKADVLDLLGVGKKIRNIQDEYFWKYTVPILEKQAGGEDYYAGLEQWAKEQDAMTASQRAAGSDDGSYHWSFAGARANSNYGWRIHPITHDRKFHHGVDIPAPNGTNIGAARSGTVIEVGSTAARGNYIKVQHDDGLVTLYQHCASIIAQQGEKVAQDQTIATVGSTGKVTGPHLHLEVWKNGKDVDPMQYLGK